jgi:hypothetical protein
MAEIKTLDRIVEKWQRRAAQASTDYDAGVSNPRRDWAQAANAANNSYRDAVTAAAQAGNYGRGVQRAGTPKWQNRAKVLGSARFGPGVAAATDDYSRGFAPYREAIAGAQLPARRPRRDPGNRQRINAVLDAVVAAKQRVQGTTPR